MASDPHQFDPDRFDPDTLGNCDFLDFDLDDLEPNDEPELDDESELDDEPESNDELEQRDEPELRDEGSSISTLPPGKPAARDTDPVEPANLNGAGVNSANCNSINLYPGSPLRETPGDPQVPAALLALYRPLPEVLYVLLDARRHCFCYRRVRKSEDCGLVCFVRPDHAYCFLRTRLRVHAFDQIWPLSLEQAHALARRSSPAVNCLLLMDEACQETVCYVR